MFVCTICGLTRDTQSKMDRHMENHIEGGDDTFSCRTCNVTFKGNDDLKNTTLTLTNCINHAEIMSQITANMKMNVILTTQPFKVINKFVTGVVKSSTKSTFFCVKAINIKGTLPDNAMIATVDVSSLFTVIPQQEGAECMRQKLNTRQNQQVLTEYLIRILEACNEHNIF